MTAVTELDAVILGGGAAGLWTLAALREAGYAAILLESRDLGSGQTIASQGILHGGLKYTLSGLLSPAAAAISDMPSRWRACLAGEQSPDLSRTRLRAEFCHLWRTDSISSRLSMIGANVGLRVKPEKLDPPARPAALAACPGTVARLDEQVIEPGTFIGALADAHRAAIFKIDSHSGLEFASDARTIRLLNPETGEPVDLRPQNIVLCAGSGNACLREMLGLAADAMQRRPLHMVLVRGVNLPIINGHCVDGKATRATITSTRDTADRIVWQVGGQIAERGVDMPPEKLIQHAVSEIQAILPGVDLSGSQWATHRVDRAEAATGAGARPDDAFVKREGDIITVWPTKLVLAPRAADRVLELLEPPHTSTSTTPAAMRGFPTPSVALPPWETDLQWTIVD